MAAAIGAGLVRTNIERYVKLTDPEWALVEPHWHERSFAKAAFVSRAEVVEQWFYIVREGVQRLYFEHDGNEHCLGFAYGGSWSGDYDSFVRQRPGRFFVQAVTESKLIGIRRSDLLDLYDRIPAMERFGRLILEELIVGRATREVEQLSLSARERYRMLVQRSPQLLQIIAQKDIASYLRMTPETFSRMRAREI
ncbi:MAG: Crp/Fnr family transcriptional regulator [Flavobacteriales bacterium]|nr:Crp/Fnr family transcriptional regulator [Flavobacteriales bacterium]